MRFHSSRKLAIAAVLGALIFTGCSTASSEQATNNDGAEGSEATTVAVEADDTSDTPAAIEVRYFVDDDGLAIRGTDPVAYFTESAPVAGTAEFTHDWNGATWQFATAENRDLFAADPEKYAPQYGGFCAWAVSQGYTAPVDPEAWKIVEGKLYLNYDKKVQKRWEKDVPGHISQADENWPGVLAES